jgi:choline dehydrogenase-like flavoprotein
LSDTDKNTLKQAAITTGEVLAKTKVGRVKPRQWLMESESEFPGLDSEQVGGHHHMCTTRMSDSPQNGVVDKNLKVHGIDNLYVAGSSSFGSTGHSNPTFTIIQLSLQLAEHLSSLMLK